MIKASASDKAVNGKERTEHDDYDICCAINSASVAEPVKDVQGDDRWNSMHKNDVRDCGILKPDILFVGDSLIQRFAETEDWDTLFRPMNVVNAGIDGDQTQHVLWRLQNGLLEKCNPSIVVVLVGTNNYDHSAEEIVEGLEAIAWCINGFKPSAKIVLLGLLPRGERPNSLREKIYQVNYGLERLCPGIPNTYFHNPDPGFVREDGSIKCDDMMDYLHMTRRGYKKFAANLHMFLKKVQQECNDEDGYHVI